MEEEAGLAVTKKSRLLQISLVVFCSVVEVRAKASSLIQQPADCYGKSIPCAVKTKKAGWLQVRRQSDGGGSNAFLGGDSALFIDKAGQLALVSGVVWIDSTQPFLIKTIYGDVMGMGQFWVKKSATEVSVGVGSGEAQLIPKSGDEALLVKAGLYNWIGPVQSKGRTSSGIPQPLILQHHLKLWAALAGPSMEEQDFEEQVREFLPRWHHVVQVMSRRLERMATRQLASVRKRRERSSELRMQRKLKEKSVRELFRKRNHLN